MDKDEMMEKVSMLIFHKEHCHEEVEEMKMKMNKMDKQHNELVSKFNELTEKLIRIISIGIGIIVGISIMQMGLLEVLKKVIGL